MKEFPANLTQYVTPPKEYFVGRHDLPTGKSFLFRTGEFGEILPADPFKDDCKLIIMGDSSVENKYCDESRRFSSVIQRNFLRSFMPVQVLNFGYSGTNLLHIFNVIFNKVIPLAPKAIVIVVPSNERRTLCLESTHWNNDKHYSNFFPAPEERAVFDRRWRERIGSSKKILKIISAGCALYGIKVVVHSAICNDDSCSEFNRIVGDFCGLEGIPFIDADGANGIDAIKKVGFYDREHLNELGGDYFGNAIYSELTGIIEFEKMSYPPVLPSSRPPVLPSSRPPVLPSSRPPVSSRVHTHADCRAGSPLILRVLDKIHFKSIPVDVVRDVDKFFDENGMPADTSAETNIPVGSMQAIESASCLKNISYDVV